MSGKTCGECGKVATRIRKERCDACYMRLYRGGEVPGGACCVGCEEARRNVLLLTELDGGDVVVCGNCSVILARTRPRITAVVELQRRVTRDRRVGVAARRGEAGRRLLDRLPLPPILDPSID